MKVKITFQQLFQLINLNQLETNYTYENAFKRYPFPDGIIIDAEPIIEYTSKTPNDEITS